jgi:hypothetical protein
MATEAAWLKGRNSQGGREEQKHPYRKERKKERKKNILDTHRPSHGRTLLYPSTPQNLFSEIVRE